MSESIPNTIQHTLASYLSLPLIGQKEINPQKNEPKHQQPTSARKYSFLN